MALRRRTVVLSGRIRFVYVETLSVGVPERNTSSHDRLVQLVMEAVTLEVSTYMGKVTIQTIYWYADYTEIVSISVGAPGVYCYGPYIKSSAPLTQDLGKKWPDIRRSSTSEGAHISPGSFLLHQWDARFGGWEKHASARSV